MVTIKDMLEAGVHFGHQTNRWNPKMKPYIFGEKNGIYIIDLQQSAQLFQRSYDFVRDTVTAGETVLFVGTKRQAVNIVEEEAKRCNMFYVTQRWLGGMLNNFQTIRKSVNQLKTFEAAETDGTYDRLKKKEILLLEKENEKIELVRKLYKIDETYNIDELTNLNCKLLVEKEKKLNKKTLIKRNI